MSLEIVNLAHVFLNASILIFLLHVCDCSEICTVGPVLVLVSCQVNCMTEGVAIHGIDTSQYVVYEMRGERVVAVLSIHFNNSKVVLVHAVDIEHASTLLVIVVSMQMQLVFGNIATGGFQ